MQEGFLSRRKLFGSYDTVVKDCLALISEPSIAPVPKYGQAISLKENLMERVELFGDWKNHIPEHHYRAHLSKNVQFLEKTNRVKFYSADNHALSSQYKAFMQLEKDFLKAKKKLHKDEQAGKEDTTNVSDQKEQLEIAFSIFSKKAKLFEDYLLVPNGLREIWQMNYTDLLGKGKMSMRQRRDLDYDLVTGELVTLDEYIIKTVDMKDLLVLMVKAYKEIDSGKGTSVPDNEKKNKKSSDYVFAF